MPAKKRNRKHTLNPIIILSFLIIGLLLVTVAMFSKSTSLSNNLKTQIASSPSPIMNMCNPFLATGTVTPTAAPGLAEKNGSIPVNPPNSTNLTPSGTRLLLKYAGGAYDAAKNKAIDKLYKENAPLLALSVLKCADKDCTIDDNATIECKRPPNDKITLDPTKTEYLDSIRQLLAAGGTNTQLLTWEDYIMNGTKRNVRISAYVTATGPVLCQTACIGKYPMETSTPDVTQCGGAENEPACAPAATMIQTILAISDPGTDTSSSALKRKLETQAKERLDTQIGTGCINWLNQFASKFSPPNGCSAANPVSSTRTDHDTCDNDISFSQETNYYHGQVWCRATCNATQDCRKKTIVRTFAPAPVTSTPTPTGTSVR
jgi:hypothetical protein